MKELSFFERRKVLKNTSLLDLTPVAKVGHEVGPEGLITLLYPKFKRATFNFLIPARKSPFIRLSLDEIGSESWLLIDGKRNVGEIAQKLTEKFGDKVQPAADRLGKFLSQLYNNKYISFTELLKKES